jgi:hypothetical protein
MYSVYQHWDPLNVCLVGRTYPPEFYSWIKDTNTRARFEKLAEETEEDYQSLIQLLTQKFGVKIHRPQFPENFNDSQLLLTKIIFIVAAILVLTFLIYFFSTSLYAWFYKSVLLNLISITDGFTLKLLSILGCGPVHNVGFTDTAGNIYLVKLALDDSTIQILIKAVNTSHYISVDRYVASLNLSIINLRSQVNAILNSTPPNMGTIADNTEITSLITEFSQLF